MQFVKMHGIGNDYVYVNAFEMIVESPEKLAVRVSDRHFGVGADGLILVAPPTAAGKASGATVRMRMFNADGSESEMCGNGVRCVAKFAYDRGLSRQNPMRVETGRGVLNLALTVENEKVTRATVNMGQPILELEKIPVDAKWLARSEKEHEYLIPYDVRAKTATPATRRGETPAVHGVPATFVSMGNPHAVIFAEDAAKIELEKIGPMLERHQAFPRRMNVHFVQVHARNAGVSPAGGAGGAASEVTMRTWERGSGITLACGTGASAVCVAGVLTGRTARSILAHLPGGDLQLEWREADRNVYMTGPATEVFTGTWPDT